MRTGWIVLIILALVGPSSDPDRLARSSGLAGAAARRVRVVIYLRGTEAEMDEQLLECQALCDRRRYHVVGIARERPGQTSTWEDCARMRREKEVDRVIFASTSVIPAVLESATGTLPGLPDRPPAPAPAPRREYSPRHRRPRPPA